MDFSWAQDYPDVQNLCKKFNLLELHNALKIKYKPLNGLIQDGPQCGLVALAICMEKPTSITVNKLYEEAVKRNFTFNGEMFSCKEMHKLTLNNMSNKITLYCGLLNTSFIKQFLFDGGMLLVPYDCDKNYSPFCANGHKAHWAVICGIITTESTTFVIARQGKSKNITIWNLKDLSESNAQLKEFSPNRKTPSMNYKLPDGGLEGFDGLCCQSICVWPNKIRNN